jgi:5-methylcytosine-specific restriction endonuclease McrA
MLGTDKSRGYCLEMICADFLGWSQSRRGQLGCALIFNPAVVQVSSGRRTKRFSASSNRESLVNGVRPKQPHLRLNSELYDQLRNQVLCRDGWRCQSCGTMSNLDVHHKQSRSQSGHDSEENLITVCMRCHAQSHNY